MSAPIPLLANQPPNRFYSGGARIAAFRRMSLTAGRVPEDWVGSTTTLAGDESVGLTRLPDGRRLIDVIQADPVGWLGDEHVAAFGTDTRLLVKLLDAGERLPVHAHPDAAFARRHIGRHHGKAEAWLILSRGTIHLGLRRSVEFDELEAMVSEQRTDALLGLLHRREVEPGDTVFVPPGMLHAIGEGVFLVEAQEPEDLSILLEWKGFAIDGAALGHLGLGFDVALSGVTRTAAAPDQIDDLILRQPIGPTTLPSAAARYFRLAHLRPPSTSPASFAVLIVIEGDITLTYSDGELELPSGSTVVVPHAAGDLQLSGSGSVVICRPPSPRAE